MTASRISIARPSGAFRCWGFFPILARQLPVLTARASSWPGSTRAVISSMKMSKSNSGSWARLSGHAVHEVADSPRHRACVELGESALVLPAPQNLLQWLQGRVRPRPDPPRCAASRRFARALRKISSDRVDVLAVVSDELQVRPQVRPARAATRGVLRLEPEGSCTARRRRTRTEPPARAVRPCSRNGRRSRSC